jgi:hypothetical protein
VADPAFGFESRQDKNGDAPIPETTRTRWKLRRVDHLLDKRDGVRLNDHEMVVCSACTGSQATSELPVEQTTKVQLGINLKTARTR